jgi:hypothetical protein
MNILKRFGFLWITLVLFLTSLAGHWTFGWWTYVEDARAHNQPVTASAYALQMLRDTFENWQSEFLQLMWQVAGLAFLLHVGSPQSKENGERLEAKIDFLMEQTEEGVRAKSKIDQRFVRNMESLHDSEQRP